MIIKKGNKDLNENKIPVRKIPINDAVKDLMIQYKHLVIKDMKSKSYTNLILNIRNELKEELKSSLVFLPEDMLKTFILTNILTYKLIYSVRILRSLDISEIAFGKWENIRSLNSLNDKYLFIIMDKKISEYLQTALIHLYEIRENKGLVTIIIHEMEVEDYIDEYPIMDKYFFPKGDYDTRYGIFYTDFHELKKSKFKRGVWNL